MNLGLKDFFIGVVHLFVIFLPGAVVLLTFLYVGENWWDENMDFFVKVGNVGTTLLFIGASYFLGHLISLIGSFLEDSISVGFRKKESGLEKATLRRMAQDICTRHLNRELVSAKTLRRWAAILVRREGGLLQSNIDAKDADRRFFRNILLVLLIVFVAVIGIPFAECVPEHGFSSAMADLFGDKDDADNISLLACTGIIVLAILAYFRYADQDWKFTQLVFESLLALESKKTGDSGLRRTIATHAGGIVFRDDSWRTKYLLVGPDDEGTKAKPAEGQKNYGKKKEWLLPKGHIEKRECPEETAIREVYEETGQIVNICAFLDFVYYQAGREDLCVAHYLMKPAGSKDKIAKRRTKTWKKGKDRKKAWENFEKAKSSLNFAESLAILEVAEKRANACRKNRLISFFGDPQGGK